MSQLPPYSAQGPAEGSIPSAQVTSNTIAGNVQTCSIRDRQHDYYKIVRDSSVSYHVCLTVDPTPIYRIELTKDPSAAGDIIIFPSSGPSSLPVAAARFGKNPKRGDAVATICSSSPHLQESPWLPFTKDRALTSMADYKSTIPIVAVPGLAPTHQAFGWHTLLSRPNLELWWEGPLPLQSPRSHARAERDYNYPIATCLVGEAGGDIIVEMTRGGGLQFELAVLLQMFVLLRPAK
jgi:hypothetical protein